MTMEPCRARFTAMLITVTSLLPAVAWCQDHPQNPFEAQILAARPRVFLRHDEFDGLTVDGLRASLDDPEYRGIFDRWRGQPLGRALRWLTRGDRQDLDAAVTGLKRMQTGAGTWSDRGQQLVRLATLFDWLYDDLDEATRVEVIAKIEQEADAAAEHIRRGQAPFYYSRTPGALAGLTIAGITLHGVSDKADEYLRLFRTWGVNEYFKAYDWVDGAATGATYAIYYTYVDLTQICAAWWSATGVNPTFWINEHQGNWLDEIAQFYLWYMRPSFAFTDINDQYRDNWSSHDQFAQGLDIASYVTRNGHGREWSERWQGRFGNGLYHTNYVHNYIFRDVTLEAAPLDDLPRAQLFGRDSCGYGFFRSHWPAPDEPDTATHVFFRCGDPMNVHGGVSAGEFQIFKVAPLAARSGRYGSYDSDPDQYHRNCISTNVVLFTDPADPQDRGDQHTRRGLKYDHRDWADWLAIRDRCGLDVATITDWQVTPEIARCRADLTKTNPAEKCLQWIREFAWLADRHLVVLDVIQSAQPEIRCRWQLHADNRPEIGDHSIRLVSEAPDLNWADSRLKPKTDRAQLFCQTVLPERYAVILHDGEETESWDALGRSTGPAAGNPYHLRYGKRVVQIDAGDASHGLIFLNVLTAAELGEAMPTITHQRPRPDQIELTVGGVTATFNVPEPSSR